MDRWDRRGMELARLVASWSKDPCTRVGASILRPDRTVASVGMNGLPRGVEDTPERLNDRETKLAMVRHAEENAIAFAREPLEGHTLYVSPLHPCPRCAGAIIQSGIARVVYEIDETRWIESKWVSSWGVSMQMFREARVSVECFTENGHAEV